ncbi:MAG: hypothetical protein COA96_10375 [SAR86 cluster bacterium]|uniref:FlgD Ig-like domain-containing protein n=1 Tax=SAR86 cluster bacterium TaxID=2030880 RepID=A0A2A5AY15_9GAMM|nr:MAG: hypothetical protein COA96_10375 [SAR86 cluster bacterium]
MLGFGPLCSTPLGSLSPVVMPFPTFVPLVVDLCNPIISEYGPIRIFRKGASIPFIFSPPCEIYEEWVCTIHVKAYKSDVSLITRVIPLDGRLVWSGYLTSTESDTLSVPNLYRIIAVLTNATTNQEKQIPYRFQINNAWA